MKIKLLIVIFISLFLLSACSLTKSKKDIIVLRVNEPVACTMEAKICPDGSAVGRTSPDCEFSSCPGTNAHEATTNKVYFGNSNSNPNSIDCTKVYSVERIIKPGADVEVATLNELFKGPNSNEKKQGYTSWFSDKTITILKSFKVEDGVAYVDLIDIRNIIPNASASCGSSELLSEMENTLKQFPLIKKVLFSINGNQASFYEWLQLSPPVE
ncbi:MAG: GerMN domain-containing protein [Candidatus Falkowbacteria bacterium]